MDSISGDNADCVVSIVIYDTELRVSDILCTFAAAFAICRDANPQIVHTFGDIWF